jgi:adenylate kinase
MNHRAFIFIGRSGSGKGTQVKLLTDYLAREAPGQPILYIETGQQFRDYLTNNSQSAKLSRVISETGGRQPAFLATLMWAGKLVGSFSGNEIVIFDGAPRSLDEAKILDTAVSFYGLENPVAVYLDVSAPWARERLLGRERHDDQEKLIEAKMKWFESDVLPAVRWYQGNPQYLFVPVTGEDSIEEVHKKIINQL